MDPAAAGCSRWNGLLPVLRHNVPLRTDRHQLNEEEAEMDATTIGVDLAKSVFELALANAAWRVIGRKRLTRAQFERFLATQPPTHVVMEACGTAHYWEPRRAA